MLPLAAAFPCPSRQFPGTVVALFSINRHTGFVRRAYRLVLGTAFPDDSRRMLRPARI